ncbi:lysoplasmalogenase [Kordiimonas aquimaris]|uniref:lysoplasmalogenase n=1 Tax=Kordiimonas aquimaris TaxID=707591 RepID=UPI0021CFE9C6|nr:lysoplasmalogenase [Kordiimonas aquimaris]
MTQLFGRRKRPIVEGIGQLMLFLSAVASVVYVGGWYPEGLLWQPLAKAGAVGFLALFVIITAQTSNHMLLILALLASVVGDVMLVLPAENSFLHGLSAFFAAHVVYIFLFMKNRMHSADITSARTRISALYWALGGVAAFLLYPTLGDMLIPVFAYILVLTLMATMAMFSRFPPRLVGFGVTLFLISDGLLGAGKFLNFTYGEPYAVWGTYYFAQLFITLGVMIYDERPTHFGGYRFD